MGGVKSAITIHFPPHDMQQGRENSMTQNIRWKAVGFLMVSLWFSITESWADSAEDRIRSHFNIPASVPLTEETIKQAVLRVLPEGSLAISIKPKLLDLGIGEKGLSNYGESGKDNVAVIRIEYDPKTIDVVKRSYIISLYLTSEPIRTVQYISLLKNGLPVLEQRNVCPMRAKMAVWFLSSTPFLCYPHYLR